MTGSSKLARPRKSSRIAAHAKQSLTVVRLSGVDGAGGGLGLWANQNIASGTTIGIYKGKFMTRKDALAMSRKQATHLCVLRGSGLVLDGAREPAGSMHPPGGGCMQMVNHCSGRGATALNCNARRRDAAAGATHGTNGLCAMGQVHLVAKRAIPRGQEILFDYGRTYWTMHTGV
jgi:hypothetical protein